MGVDITTMEARTLINNDDLPLESTIGILLNLPGEDTDVPVPMPKAAVNATIASSRSKRRRPPASKTQTSKPKPATAKRTRHAPSRYVDGKENNVELELKSGPADTTGAGTERNPVVKLSKAQRDAKKQTRYFQELKRKQRMAAANVAVDSGSDIELSEESVETNDAAADGGFNTEPDGDDTDPEPESESQPSHLPPGMYLTKFEGEHDQSCVFCRVGEQPAQPCFSCHRVAHSSCAREDGTLHFHIDDDTAEEEWVCKACWTDNNPNDEELLARMIPQFEALTRISPKRAATYLNAAGLDFDLAFLQYQTDKWASEAKSSIKSKTKVTPKPKPPLKSNRTKANLSQTPRGLPKAPRRSTRKTSVITSAAHVDSDDDFID